MLAHEPPNHLEGRRPEADVRLKPQFPEQADEILLAGRPLQQDHRKLGKLVQGDAFRGGQFMARRQQCMRLRFGELLHPDLPIHLKIVAEGNVAGVRAQRLLHLPLVADDEGDVDPRAFPLKPGNQPGQVDRCEGEEAADPQTVGLAVAPGHRSLVQPQRCAVSPVGVDQRGMAFVDDGLDNLAHEDDMGADAKVLHQFAIEGNEVVDDDRCTGPPGGPCRTAELVVARREHSAGEGVGHEGLIVAQQVHAEHAVPEYSCTDRAQMVHTNQQCRQFAFRRHR